VYGNVVSQLRGDVERFKWKYADVYGRPADGVLVSWGLIDDEANS
jgi:hypothetical protein